MLLPVVGLALLQILVAIVILVSSSATLIRSRYGYPALTYCMLLPQIFMASSLSNDDPAPHPGPYKPAFAIAINIAATCLWAVGNVGHAWCAWTGGMPDRSSVQVNSLVAAFQRAPPVVLSADVAGCAGAECVLLVCCRAVDLRRLLRDQHARRRRNGTHFPRSCCVFAVRCPALTEAVLRLR
eukprot:3541607-Rhodomonas_salina.1